MFTNVTRLFTTVSVHVSVPVPVTMIVYALRNIPGDDLNEFLREFPYYMLVVRKPGELAGGAHLLHDVVDAGLTKKSFVSFYFFCHIARSR